MQAETVPAPSPVPPVPEPAETIAAAAAAVLPPEVPVVAAPTPSTFDAALASAFGDVAGPPTEVPAAVEKQAKKPVEYRTVAPDPRTRKSRARGPIVDAELSLARGIEPVEPAEPEPAAAEAEPEATKPERPPETQAWRRTAMAELTALATDTDDLTPRRRR